MTEAVVDDIVTVLPPLLNALEALGFFTRNLHPPAFASVMNAIGAPDAALQAAHAAIGAWPEQFTGLRERLDRACNETLAAFAGIRGRARQWRSRRGLPRAAPSASCTGGAVSAVDPIFAGQQLLPQRRQSRE